MHNSLFRKGILTIPFVLLSIFSTQGQRLTTGLTYDIFGIHPTFFPSDIIFSETNYRAYYIKQFQAPSRMMMNMSLNLGVDYGRFFLITKFGLSSTLFGVTYKLSYPISENDFKDYFSRITYQQTDISASLGYNIKAERFLKPFVEAGVGRSAPYFYSEDFSTDKKFKTLWSGRQEIRNLMELDKSYNYILAGFGWRGDLMSLGCRYKVRIGRHDVFYSVFSVGMSISMNKGMLRKYYIYQPEE